MGVTNSGPLTPAEALAWLVQVSAYSRFEVGPPGLVRVVVMDPLDPAQQVEVLRAVVDDVTAEGAFLGAVLDAKEGVEAAQAQGRFAFIDADDRGWRDGRPAW